MALKGLDIFKLTPKTNCKDCGVPTCMAFAMKVAQGSASIEQCPHMSPDALDALSEATAPPMKKISVGSGDGAMDLGGETVLFRHDKTFVSKNLFAVTMPSEAQEGFIAETSLIDYERIGERMKVELMHIEDRGDSGAFVAEADMAAGAGYSLILETKDPASAKAALSKVSEGKPILLGADSENYEAMNSVATEFGVALGVTGNDIDSLYDTTVKLEGLGNKNLILDLGTASIKNAFENSVQVRRAALKSGDRSFGYPSIVNVGKLAAGDSRMETAIASLFILKYGSVIILSAMSYPQALPLFGLRQNIFTDPQKPMTVETGIYPLNGADENAPCAVTVDFALTYFIISGEVERSGVPVNMIIPDAGGYSVLTAWAAGKFSAGSISRFIKESGAEEKIKNHTLLIPGKVAVLKGELEENLPGWKIVVAPNEAVSLVKFLKEMAS